MRDGKWWFIAIFVVPLLIFAISHTYMKSRGYHLEWSAANMRWIYVDVDGKP